MNFTKSMIDLVREIRRRASATEKPNIKLANPDLFSDLIPWYQSTNDAVVKALIKELFSLAGDSWAEQLKIPDAPTSHDENSRDVRYVTKVYRGQTQLVEVAAKEVSDEPPAQRMYRGQVVR